MKIINTKLDDVKIIENNIFKDDRGLFFESYNKSCFSNQIKKDISFVQDNHSKSKMNVVRGLHYQIPPKAQGKLVRVLKGQILDVVVDLRKTSSTFAKWICIIICSEKKNQIWIPPGFAHGFLAKTNDCEVLYKTTEYYFPEYEKTIIWDDPTLNIDWGIENPKLSNKDLNGKFFRDSYHFEN